MNLCKGCSRRLLCGNEFTQSYCTGFQRSVNLQIDIALNSLEESLKLNKMKMILEQGQIDDYHNCMKGISENYRKGINNEMF